MQKGCEKVVCERWVGDATDCNILTPSFSDYSSTPFSFCWTAQQGFLRAKPSTGSWFTLPRTATPTNWLQLTHRASHSPKLDWTRPESKSQLTSFSKSPNSLPIASGHDVILIPVPVPIWGFHYDICDCHILWTRAWTVLNVCTYTCTCTKPNSSKSNQTEW